MSIETVARRYSTALADVVTTHGDVTAVRKELAAWSELVSSNPDLATVFANPAIAHANKEKVLDQLIAKTKPSQTTANFLRVLLKNGRLTELAEINTRFEAEIEERSGTVSAEITSARELPAAEQKDFQDAIEKLTGKKVTVNYSVDETLIGGVVTRIGSTVYDGSIKTKLENLREQLITG
ncbi:MAG: F0F1 ATP synthase subunit delta [Acidobacteria bacterium]|nr:F0F1 ATP synthase subunit delta [Acidobacteriota bacterium]